MPASPPVSWYDAYSARQSSADGLGKCGGTSPATPKRGRATLGVADRLGSRGGVALCGAEGVPHPVARTRTTRASAVGTRTVGEDMNAERAFRHPRGGSNGGKRAGGLHNVRAMRTPPPPAIVDPAPLDRASLDAQGPGSRYFNVAGS